MVIALVGLCRPSGQTSLQWMRSDFRRVRRIPMPGKRAKNKAALAVAGWWPQPVSGKGEPKVVQKHRCTAERQLQDKCPRFVVTLLHVRDFLYHPASPDSRFLSLPTRLYCSFLKRPLEFPSAAETLGFRFRSPECYLSFSFVLVWLCYPRGHAHSPPVKTQITTKRRDNTEA